MGGLEKVWWSEIKGPTLAQGDYLPRCIVPFFDPDYGTGSDGRVVLVKEYDCIVVTQSCDLENDKAPLVAMCPIMLLANYEIINPASTKKGAWERVRQGRVEGIHLLASMHDSADNRQCFVIDFHEIYSLPIAYLKSHASSLEHRWRLQSPYLEHFSQAFARFFMRVGLPSSIAAFK